MMDAWRNGAFILVISEAILLEISNVLRRPHIRQNYRVTSRAADLLLASLREYGVVTPGELAVEVVPDDPKDNCVVACAVEGAADYIVTGDLHLRELREYRGIPILSPAEFVRLL